MSSAAFSGRFSRFRVNPCRKVHLEWLAEAARLPGRTLHVACAAMFVASLRRSPYLRLAPHVLKRFGVSRDAGYEALTRLGDAGLVAVSRGRGRLPRLCLVDAQAKPLKLD